MVYGIVPDTNQTITVRRRAGGTRTVPVVHGVVVTPVDGVTELLVKGVDGKISTVHLPPGATRVGRAN